MVTDNLSSSVQPMSSVGATFIRMPHIEEETFVNVRGRIILILSSTLSLHHPPKRIFWLSFAIFIAGCSLIAEREMDRLYGTERVQDRIKPASELTPEELKTWTDAKHIFDSRCIVCHSCYDAACQLKLTSAEGIDRGGSKDQVYDSVRLLASKPTRLGIDAQTAAEWRKKNFFPILNERRQTPEANLQASVLYRMLNLKQKNPLPPDPIVKGDIDFSLDRDQICASDSEIGSFERDHPTWGMPFGLPGISDKEFSTVKHWLQTGALMSKSDPLTGELAKTVTEWENFFNGSSLKEKLMSRYIYEHLFLGDLVFDTIDKSRSFKLIRSKTPSGTPVKIIPTRRPTEDPGSTFYYRLVPTEETTVSKTQMVYDLNPARMTRYRELFLAPSYEVTELPSYDPEVSNNPFKVFAAIPPSARYRFMLDEAKYFVMGFIKGPVCRGQVALSVIQDRFWVFFTKPTSGLSADEAAFLATEGEKLTLPAEAGSNAGVLFNWNRYSSQEKEYLAAKRKLLASLAEQGVPVDQNGLWNGDGANQNAALTVFRNFDSAHVVQGLVGEDPKTAWVIGYPTFERIHYLLVADFDVFGNVGHQLLTRLYMDFLRVESENNFLVLLPKSTREAEHDSWYQGIGSEHNEYTMSPENFDWAESDIQYSTDKPKHELFGKLKSYLGPALNTQYDLKQTNSPALTILARVKGLPASIMPEISVVRVLGKSKPDAIYTIALDRARENVAVLYMEKAREQPEDDKLTVVPGFLSAYPNAYFSVREADLNIFAKQIANLKTEEDYTKLRDRFGVRRTDPKFWEFSDWMQEQHRKASESESGVLDYNRLENR